MKDYAKKQTLVLEAITRATTPQTSWGIRQKICKRCPGITQPQIAEIMANLSDSGRLKIVGGHDDCDLLYELSETYRVNHIPQVPGKPWVSCELYSLSEAERFKDNLALHHLHLLHTKIVGDFSNHIWIEQLVNGEWEAIEEDY